MNFSTTLKSLTVSVSFALAACAFVAPAHAETESRPGCSPALWTEVKMLARDCARDLKTGRGCTYIKVYSTGRSAAFYLGDDLYRVRMEESAYSDGGDLDDLYIEREDGCRLTRKNVPAFGDILAALAR